MKKLLWLFLSMTLIILFVIQCFVAEDGAVTSDAFDAKNSCFEDDSLTAVKDERNSISGMTTTKSKTSAYYSSDDQPLWYLKVTGTFTYDGRYSSCIASSVSGESYSSNWKVINKAASHSDATATAKCIGKCYLNRRQIKSVNETVTLTCDKNGNFS